jgi:lactose/L-arabinose transport system permease protein
MSQKGQYARSLNRVGWLFVTPALTLFAVFMLYPIVSSLYLVMRKWKGTTDSFIGLGNFVRMAGDSVFWHSLGTNFFLMAVQIPIMVFLALILAVIIDQGIRRFRGAFRLMIFLPCITSLVAYSVLFRILLQTNGMANSFMMNLGLITQPVSWLSDPLWANITIIAALTWRWTGYNMIFFLVGLQSIDREIYEAAEVDGASKLYQFFRITLPLLLPVILFSVVTSTSGTLQLFDEPNVLTNQGGPANATMTAALYIYRQAFVINTDFGYATAMSYVVVVIAAIFAWLQIRLLGGERK